MNIEQFREICLSFPNVTEDIKWENDLCFCIGEKMFAVTGLDGRKNQASLKVLKDEFEGLIERAGISKAPYLGRYHWILADYSAFTPEEWQYYLQQSYTLVKSKLPAKIRKKLE